MNSNLEFNLESVGDPISDSWIGDLFLADLRRRYENHLGFFHETVPFCSLVRTKWIDNWVILDTYISVVPNAVGRMWRYVKGERSGELFKLDIEQELTIGHVLHGHFDVLILGRFLKGVGRGYFGHDAKQLFAWIRSFNPNLIHK